MVVVPPYILGFLCIMDQNVINFLLYTRILISQKINFVIEVRFSQKWSQIIVFVTRIAKTDLMALAIFDQRSVLNLLLRSHL